MTNTSRIQTATFGGGCFWCTEAVFQRLAGVEKVVSGYAGGEKPSPSYEAVCSGRTGHAEAVQVTFDPQVISFADLLEVFFATHDPTTLNRQGNDVGTQYRSVIFYHDEPQRETAEAVKRQLDASGEFSSPIVTQIVPYTGFFAAEDYHQNYYNDNSGQPYCRVIISPKLGKLRKKFAEKLKSGIQRAP
jgi:peptide-methionine (S)-S-oxide reductase